MRPQVFIDASLPSRGAWMVTWFAIAGDFARIACFRKGMGYSFETNLLGLIDLSFEKTSWCNELQMQLL